MNLVNSIVLTLISQRLWNKIISEVIFILNKRQAINTNFFKFNFKKVLTILSSAKLSPENHIIVQYGSV